MPVAIPLLTGYDGFAEDWGGAGGGGGGVQCQIQDFEKRGRIQGALVSGTPKPHKEEKDIASCQTAAECMVKWVNIFQNLNNHGNAIGRVN